MTQGPALCGGISQRVGCSGLYCHRFRHFIRIRNPDTREFLDPRTTDIESDLDPMSLRITNHPGFDPVEKQHKVLKPMAGQIRSRPTFLFSRKTVGVGRTLNS
ncbi:hypothetical protein CDL15_Pgr002876 [Punica granatum]|uniref:Uncharacterized protein n=1 Tax=Punica granatum TaxID=22663 RepID=A0A218X0K0_PUNGR|nr:hypothetical protein CDL15_Pgr002876 [Punica granatum]